MTGYQLKRHIKASGFQVKQVAEALGTTRQNLQNKLSRDDVSSNLIEDVAKVLQKPVSYLYGENISATLDSEIRTELRTINDKISRIEKNLGGNINVSM